MPRKCVICDATQSMNLSVFGLPKSSHLRRAWITAIQQSITTFYSPQMESTLSGSQYGVCEHHFLSQDIKKGKKSSLHRRAIPMAVTDLQGQHSDLEQKEPVISPLLPKANENTTFIGEEVDSDSTATGMGESLDSMKREERWNVGATDSVKCSHTVLDVDIHDYLPSDNAMYLEPDENTQEDYLDFKKEKGKNNVCLVCGKNGKDSNPLVCALNVSSYSSNLSFNFMLSRIVGRPKREVLCVSMLVCRKCCNLITEATQLEDELKVKKQVITDMFETTLQDHKEQNKIFLPSSQDAPNSQSNCNELTCGESGTYESNLPENLSDVDEKYRISDTLCESSRKTSRRQASAKKYCCPQCKEEYSSLALWVHHLSKHSDPEDLNPQVKSKQIGSKAKRKAKLGVHVCEECNKTFYCKQSLLAHVSTHQKGSDCSVCGRYLTTKARLKAHLFHFHGIGEEKHKEVACSDCGKCFTTKAGLRYHLNVVHHVGTKYVCEHCSKVFYYHVPYKSHMLYAHGEKKIVCETCGEKFFTISKLNTHINAVHRNAQSWTCDKCQSKFTTHTSYRHHMNIKHLKVQHPCDYCNAQFRKKASLYLHLRKHSIYICQICRENFSCSDNMKDHMSVVHGKDIIWKGKRKENASTILPGKKLAREEDFRQKASTPLEHMQSQNVASIVMSDLLMTSGSYDNSSLQPFSLSCEKLPEKLTCTNDEDIKVKTLSIIDTSQELQEMNPVQFSTVDVKSNHDHIGMTSEVSLINVQILRDMEISQSDTLGDLKSSMLTDTADQLEDNLAAVESHLSGEHMSVSQNLEVTSHSLEGTSHLETTCHLQTSEHIETSCHHLQESDTLATDNPLGVENPLDVELDSPHELRVPNHLEQIDSASPLNPNRNLNHGSTLNVNTSMEISAHLEASDHLDTSEPLTISTHIHASPHMEPSIHLETSSDQCSFPSMINSIERGVEEQLVNPVGYPMVTEIDEEMCKMTNETEPHMNKAHETCTSINQKIGEDAREETAQQIEKLDEVELQPYSVTLDEKGEVQYVMYISAPGDDSH